MHKTVFCTVEKEIEVISELLCNQCGHSLYKHPVKEGQKIEMNQMYHDSLFRLEDNGLYVQKVCSEDGLRFKDGDCFDFYLCEVCLFELVQSFVFKPKTVNINEENIIENGEEYG